MESRAEVARMAERRRTRKQKDAERSGETILDLIIVDERSGLGGRHLIQFQKRRHDIKMPWHRLKVGSPVVLSQFPEDRSDGVTGVVSKSKQDLIEVAFDRYPEGRQFRLDLTADEVTRQRQMAALNTVKDSRGRLGQLRKIQQGERPPAFSEEPEFKTRTELNPSQQAAVRFALAAEDVAIIHGPPGTGKTTTVVEFIIQSVERGETVLACAPSNTAVDNLLEKLVKAGQNAVRLGHPARVDESLRQNTLDGLVDESEEMAVAREMLQEAEELYRKMDRYTRAKPAKGARAEMRREAGALRGQARMMERRAINRILDDAEIICTTSTFNDSLIGDRWFDLVVIDEACQNTEPGSWFPIQKGEKVVMAGDHKQLPPTIISTEAARQGFAISLMERQVNLWGDQISRLLTVQYRMHKDIQAFSSDQFYGGELKAHDSVAQHLLCDLPSVEKNEWTETPLLFCDTAGGEWEEELEPEGESKRNPKEAEWVLRKAGQLIESGVPPHDVAIIAPYAAQVRWLRKKNVYDHLEIDTVDGFQGREKEAVIISCVRSNRIGEIGFLGDERRMNVAMTRARRKLIMIGDSSTLGNHEFFQQMLDYFESQNAYTTIWADNTSD